MHKKRGTPIGRWVCEMLVISCYLLGAKGDKNPVCMVGGMPPVEAKLERGWLGVTAAGSRWQASPGRLAAPRTR